MTMVQPATNSTAPTAISPPNKGNPGNAPKSSAVGRRALLAVAATGVVGVTALAIPQVRNSLEQDATALGRQALAHELASLEGITLDEASSGRDHASGGAFPGAAAGPAGGHHRG